MPGLLCSFSREVFLKAALWYNNQPFFPASHPSPTRNSSQSKPLMRNIPYPLWFPAWMPLHRLSFLPGIYPPSPLFDLCLTFNHYFLPRSGVTFSLQSLVGPRTQCWLYPLLSSSTPLYNLYDNYTVLHDSNLGLDVSSLLDYKYQCLYPALFLIPWCLVHIKHSINNCLMRNGKGCHQWKIYI